MAVMMVRVGDGVELCAETNGDPADPAVLLIQGATSSMDWWEPELCRLLAEAGRFTIRYDHRDTGRSTTSPVGEPGYSGEDLALDPMRLLDGIGISAAHLIGVSMGGGIAQDLAVRYPDRVLSLTLIATSCAFDRADSSPLPEMAAGVRELFAQEESLLDWEDEEAVVDEQVRVQRVFAGSLGIDEDYCRATAQRVLERSHDLHASIVNHWVAIGGGDQGLRRTMAEIHVPTLVVHGSDDPMFPLPHGRSLAQEIDGATLLVIGGMGHGVPPRFSWDTVVPAILDHIETVPPAPLTTPS